LPDVLLSCIDYYTLLRFLRARNYLYDKAMKMWLDTLEWRKEYEVDNILENFVFHEREQFLMAYPQGYHKTDKLVCTMCSSSFQPTCMQQPAALAGQQPSSCSSWWLAEVSGKQRHRYGGEVHRVNNNNQSL
jgi:hypothetical protein